MPFTIYQRYQLIQCLDVTTRKLFFWTLTKTGSTYNYQDIILNPNHPLRKCYDGIYSFDVSSETELTHRWLTERAIVATSDFQMNGGKL